MYLKNVRYDGNRTLIGFKDKSTNKDYFYLKNLQGDVVQIISSTGDVIVEYTYDPWGKVLNITGSFASTLGNENPFRYRGYYYDDESGFYYLNSRYYDPETGRFINADAYVSTGQGLSGNNMFAYCNNNPIINVDSSGQVGLSILLKFAVQSAFYGLMNATSSWMAAKATGQGFNGLDWFASFSVGAVSQLPGVGSIASGIMAGGYTFYTSIKNGATYEEAAFNATTTFVTTAVSVSSFVAGSSDKVIKDVADYAIDAVFMTGNNTVAAATNKSINTIVSLREQRPSTSDAQIICLTYTAYGFLPY